jgi:cysteinyl-tRNA synthetase
VAHAPRDARPANRVRHDLRLFNTLTRQVEPFVPLHPPRVSFYMCGPTVWNYAHVGNFRTFLMGDVLRRYLAYAGYDVLMIMNITDVDDRIIRMAGEAGTSIRAFTDRYTRAFFEDRDFLRIRPADVYTRATDYLPAMTALVQQLLDRNVAYRGDDGSIYFGITRFPTYGRLSRVDTRELKPGARVRSDEYAKDAVQDFALWKAASPADEAVGAAWNANFGRGRPGWHLECSAMALTELRNRLGVETLDLHAGGVDLVFPHHENEIAQSEGATGQPFSRCWVHGEFLTIGGTKMSKRFGNTLTVRDLREEGVHPAAFRTLVFSTHYRQSLNYNDEALQAATEGMRRLGAFRARLVEVVGGGAPGQGPNEAAVLDRQFRDAMDDDLGTPKAMGAIFTFVRDANRALDAGAWDAPTAAAALGVFDRVLDVLDVLPGDARVADDLAAWVEERLAARQAARKARDFATADAIRAELTGRGIELEDTPHGTRWKQR